MANLNINIINPTINLISRGKEVSNSCHSTITFEINSTPNADIIVAIDTKDFTNNDIDNDKNVSINLGAGYINFITVGHLSYTSYFPNTDNFSFKRIRVNLNSTGKATVKFEIGNSGSSGDYKTTSVLVKDVTNNKEERKEFTRYNDSSFCDPGNEPVAIDDNYTINAGVTSKLFVTENDLGLSPWGDNEIEIKSNPTNGLAEITTPSGSSPRITYTHDGGPSTTDTLTYTLINHKGESNEATVTIDIIQPEEPESPKIDNDTKITILFDGSGSMNETLPKLEGMVNNELKNSLLPYYTSEQEYNEKVTVKNIGKSERFLKFTNENINQTGNTIILVFQDEASSGGNDNYETFFSYDPLPSAYDTDITNLNNTLNNYSYKFNFVLFQVNQPDEIDFQNWLKFVINGEGNYRGNKGLSIHDGAKISYNILEGNEIGATQQYYSDKIIEELNNLGFNI